MSDSSLTHEQKVEKLLHLSIAMQGLILTCSLGRSGLDRAQLRAVTGKFEEIVDSSNDLVDDDA